MLSLGTFTAPPPIKTSDGKHALCPGKPIPLILGNQMRRPIISLSKSKKVVIASASNPDEGHLETHIDESTALVLREGLKAELMPKHVAMFMDGHRTWAKKKGLWPGAGYVAGGRPLRDVIRLCCELGIKVLSVYAFSTGNWLRPKGEVSFAMNIIESALKSDPKVLKRNGIRVSVIGNRAALPKRILDLVAQTEEATKDNTKLHLLAAVDYNGRSDIIQACETLAERVKNGVIKPEDIDENLFQEQLQTNCCEYPNPDLFIRTSGKVRLGNFMLWQLAYTELFFVEKYAPEFGESDFVQVLSLFQNRQRRFGGHKY